MPTTSEQNQARWQEAVDLVQRFKGGEVPDFDEVMEQIKSWRTPEDVTREVQFDMLHGWLEDTYGEYWKDPRTPWIPI